MIAPLIASPRRRRESILYATASLLGCHVFRDRQHHVPRCRRLENAQAMAAHESPRTTTLYDRTGDEITLDEVERITI